MNKMSIILFFGLTLVFTSSSAIVKNQRIDDWIGTWESSQVSIEITKSETPGLLDVFIYYLISEGNDYSVEGNGVAQPDEMDIDDGPCRIHLTLKNEFLTATDNGNCYKISGKLQNTKFVKKESRAKKSGSF